MASVWLGCSPFLLFGLADYLEELSVHDLSCWDHYEVGKGGATFSRVKAVETGRLEGESQLSSY